MFSSCAFSVSAVADVRVPKPTRPSGEEMAFSSSQSVILVLWTDSSGTASTGLLLAFRLRRWRSSLAGNGLHVGVQLFAVVAQLAAYLKKGGVFRVTTYDLGHCDFNFLPGVD